MGALRLLTYRQIAARYQVTERTVRNWAAKGAISTTQTPGGRPRVIIAEECGNIGNNTIEDDGSRAQNS